MSYKSFSLQLVLPLSSSPDPSVPSTNLPSSLPTHFSTSLPSTYLPISHLPCPPLYLPISLLSMLVWPQRILHVHFQIHQYWTRPLQINQLNSQQSRRLTTLLVSVFQYFQVKFYIPLRWIMNFKLFCLNLQEVQRTGFYQSSLFQQQLSLWSSCRWCDF